MVTAIMSYLASSTNLTPTLSAILVKAHKSDPIDPHATFQTLDSFLLEAKQIVCLLRYLYQLQHLIRL